MNTLGIKWQRLVTDGETCERCGSTEDELHKAISALKKSLSPMNIEVVLEKTEISFEEFEKNPLSSNQIWINEKPLEEWVGGIIGQSPCCGPCASCDCRTVSVDGELYETIPSDLITKAGLLAASRLFVAGQSKSVTDEPDRDPSVIRGSVGQTV